MLNEVLTPEQRAELKRLCERATPGPWESNKFRVMALRRDAHGEPIYETARYICDTANNQKTRTPENEANASIIAAARTALPSLLDEVERLEGERQRGISTCQELLVRRAEEAEERARSAESALRAQQPQYLPNDFVEILSLYISPNIEAPGGGVVANPQWEEAAKLLWHAATGQTFKWGEPPAPAETKE